MDELASTFDVHEHDMIRHDPAHEPDGARAVLLTLADWGIEPADAAVGKLVFEALNVRIRDSLPLLKDALPTLSALKERGFLLGIVTNRLWGATRFAKT
jgi:FMN phosphatase YigB (HAD superfamily)